MVEKQGGLGGLKWVIIIGGIILLLLGVLAFVFVFFLPSIFPGEQGQELIPDIPEVVMRIGIVFVVFIVGIIIVGGLVYIIYDFFFRKKELHIVEEHAKIIREAAALNPSSTLGRLIMTGKSKIQAYNIGKIVGHTQVPVKFERLVLFDENGRESKESESLEEFEERKKAAEEEGRGSYDFFAFITGKGFYGLPIFNLMEPPKIFACYPAERSVDLVGDIEIYDVGTWKYYGLFVPANRAREPTVSLEDFKNQIMPIAVTSLVDYIGLVAQRGIEGDTALQKWLEVKSSQVNVKQKE